MYWDIGKSLSYNTLFNFIIGNRGAGKTYGFKKYAIKDFLKTGSQFIYLRRYKTELKTIKTFFSDISQEFEGVEFDVKGNQFLINKEVAGWCIPLSTAKILKSTSFPKVNKICFDEFILDKGVYHYLPDEVVNFLEFYETVARSRDNVRVWFLSNAITITNPYFNYFKISIPKNKKIKRVKEDILIEMVANEEFIKMKKNTRFGRLISDTQYGAYNIENEFLRDNNKFVAKMTSNCLQIATIKYRGKTYGVWQNPHSSMIYISYKCNPNQQNILSFTTEDHQENTFLMRSNNYYTKLLREHFKFAMIRFETIGIKNEVLPLLERIV